MNRMGKIDIYQEVTDRIIAELEQGIIPWKKPWTGTRDGAISHTTGKPYSLLNQLLLGKPGEYITFNQARKEGGSVKKGAKSKMVVFWKFLYCERKDASGATVMGDDGKPSLKRVPILRYYNVFHIDDCENIKPRIKAAELNGNIKPIENAEQTFRGYLNREKIRLEQDKSDRAYYSPSGDYIHLPIIEQFEQIAEYYSTAFHEAVHSTGHETRLNRIAAGAVHFGDEEYSKEELVAEIGAAAILHEMGIETPSSFRNSAAYIQSWIKALQNDKKMIVSAAGKSEKAVDLIFGRGAEQEESMEEAA